MFSEYRGLGDLLFLGFCCFPVLLGGAVGWNLCKRFTRAGGFGGLLSKLKRNNYD